MTAKIKRCTKSDEKYSDGYCPALSLKDDLCQKHYLEYLEREVDDLRRWNSYYKHLLHVHYGVSVKAISFWLSGEVRDDSR